MRGMYNEEQIKAYFDRIKYYGGTEQSVDNLREMHRLHLLYIPYENLDLLNNIPLSLAPKDLYTKIITNRRGGYCFELQGLFLYLLKSLGYSVVQYSGRFMDEPEHIQMRRHRILVVSLNDKRYVCDVGVRSESPRVPLELVEGQLQSDSISEYRYEKDPFYGWVLMQRERNKNWKPLLGFTEEPQIDDDFIMPSFYCEKHSNSTFNKFMKISIFTGDSNKTIVGDVFSVYSGAKVTERHKITSKEEAVKLAHGNKPVFRRRCCRVGR